jgi:hypothetical protein
MAALIGVVASVVAIVGGVAAAYKPARTFVQRHRPRRKIIVTTERLSTATQARTARPVGQTFANVSLRGQFAQRKLEQYEREGLNTRTD